MRLVYLIFIDFVGIFYNYYDKVNKFRVLLIVQNYCKSGFFYLKVMLILFGVDEFLFLGGIWQIEGYMAAKV